MRRIIHSLKCLIYFLESACVSQFNSRCNQISESQLCISQLHSADCAQQERGSCLTIIYRIVSAGHATCHGDAACSKGQKEALCSRCNLLVVYQPSSQRIMPHTKFLSSWDSICTSTKNSLFLTVVYPITSHIHVYTFWKK